jgi:hypothetical protein
MKMLRITAKFNCKCGESGKPINKGTEVLWDKHSKRVYSLQSSRYKEFQEHQNRTAICDYEEALYQAGFGV